MTIRMTGLMSGLDTDAIIKELMSAQSLKKTKIENKKTKLEWKQDKWKELNTKLYSLYTKQVSKMKLQGSYKTKKVTSSNESAVTATATSSAAAGSHTLKVTKLASSQYVTGSSIKDKNVTGKTTLKELGMAEGTIIEVKAGEKTKSMTVTETTTVNDFVKELQGAGLNASFDEKQGRFFISSKESGKDNAFTITTSTIKTDTSLYQARQELEAALGENASSLDNFYDNYKAASDTLKEKQAAYDQATGTDKVTAWDELQTAKEAVKKLEDDLTALATKAEENKQTNTATEKVVADYVSALKANTSSQEYKDIESSVDKGYYKYDADGNLLDGTKTFTDAALDKAKDAIWADAKKTIEDKIADGTGNYADAEEKQRAIDEEYTRLVTAEGGEEAAKTKRAQEMYEASLESALSDKASEYAKTEEGQTKIKDQMTANGADAAIAAAGTKVTDAINSYKKALELGEAATDTTTGQLEKLGLTNITDTTKNGDGDIGLVAASDAEIVLDGATLTGASNTFTAAGITLELKGLTATTGPVTLNVSNDVDAIYDSIKGFIKEYNTILEEMNTLYNASSARGYDPLSSEEKEAMTDDQVELWENKIKDSLLRRDSTLGGISDAMRNVMQMTVEVDGKKYSLASYGIMTSSDYTERGLLHIYGDEDDSVYSDQTDKLKAALNEDPDTVAKVFSTIMGKMSETLMDKMKKTSLSSALTFYNDTQIKNQLEDYEDEIEKWEDKLKDMEDRYYEQFSAMETAMAKLNSQSSYLSSLMGTSS